MSKIDHYSGFDYSNPIIVDIEETGKYYIDNKNNICKEVIHVVNGKNGRNRVCVFRKIDCAGEIDLGVFARREKQMKSIPEYIVNRMHII